MKRRRIAMLKPSVKAIDLRTAPPAPKRSDPEELGPNFYTSAAWRRLRDRTFREASGRCQWAGCGASVAGMICDHIVEIKDGGAPLDRRNTWLLCPAHHNLKTADERRTR